MGNYSKSESGKRYPIQDFENESEESESGKRIPIQDFENEREEENQEQYQDFKAYFFSHYQIVRILGQGSCGKVCLIQHQKNVKDIYAMKMIEKCGDPLEEADYEKRYQERSLGTYTKMERNIMVKISKINDPFLLRIKSAFQDIDRFYIISEYIPGKDLYYYILEQEQYGSEIAKFYAIEILLGIESLHDLNIAHCDLKLDNILVDSKGHIKICDFGCGDVMDPNSVKIDLVGTPVYMAPEVRKKSYNRAIDWWSYGVILYMMLLGKEPFDVEKKEIDYKLNLPNKLSKEEKYLLTGLLNTDPIKRLGSKDGAEELKNHKYFYGVNWEEYKNKKNDGPFKSSSEIQQKNLENPIPLKQVLKEEKDYKKFRNFTYVSKTLLDATSKEIKNDDDSQN